MRALGVLGEGGLSAKAMPILEDAFFIDQEPFTSSHMVARGICMVACQYGFGGDAQDSKTA